MHLLLLEDDLDLGRALVELLNEEGFSTAWFRRMADGEHAMCDDFDAALLDRRLPDGDGLDLLQRWRDQGVIAPVLIITADAAIATRLRGLNSGADDYIVKPFIPQELIARVRAIHRRMARQATQVWRVGGLTINPSTREVRIGDTTVHLSRSEFDLTAILAQSGGTVVRKDRLMRCLSPLNDGCTPTAVDLHIFNLRRKLGADRIRTVRGVGYILDHSN